MSKKYTLFEQRLLHKFAEAALTGYITAGYTSTELVVSSVWDIAEAMLGEYKRRANEDIIDETKDVGAPQLLQFPPAHQ